MSRPGGWGWGFLAVCAVAVAPASAQGQQGGLDGVTRVDGWTMFEVATREDVYICDYGINHGGRWRTRRNERCVEGSVEVLLEVDRGRVVDLKHRPPGSSRGPEARVDLGRVSTGDAVEFLLELVPGGSEEVAEDALGMAALVDSVTLWPDLERFATDRGLSDEVRKSALFWLGQAAADEATRGITQVLDTPDETVDIKEAAVFALSQRPDDEAVPMLLDVARTAPHPEVRESAFFWLSQFDDPRVIAFFREVLTGP